MTYEEIMSIAPGSIVPGGCSVNPNATYMGPGEQILDSDGSALAGGHSVSTNDMIVVLDVGYTKQLALIQYPIGNGEYRQGYIVNNSNNIQYPNIGTNNWVNGSTTETVYLSYEGNQVLGSLDPHESAIFLYKVNDRYNIVYSTDKGLYTKAGFVNYSGGITAQALEGQVLSGGSGSSMENLPAGSVVPGGRTYPVNATAQVDLDLRDAQGNSIPGREVSAGDELTVLDVGYTRQLALVQYPSGGEIRQGYITNNDKYIKYTNPNNWYNGSTPEPVLDASGAQIGTINPYESATKLYEANGLTEVVYNTDKGINTKSGFVKYAGMTPNIVHVDIPYPNVTSAELINYGTSGKGRALRAYKIGNGRNSFIYNCAIHGWEDNWPADGVELTKIGNQIIEHFQNNSTGDFTLYVIPAANPDGVSEGWTNNGPGRCTIVGGIDCNRDFPVGFTPGGRPRNYTGSEPLNVPESKCLADFIQGIKSKTAGKTYLIDMHGWEQSAIGNSIIGEHFVGKLGLEPKYRYANAGYLIDWANSIGIISALIELPTSTHSHADVVNGNYAGKIIEGLTEIIGTSSSSTGGNYNGKINSGVSSVNVRQEPNTSSTILGQLHGNDRIEILAKVKPYGDSYYWYEIVFIKDGQGVQAYVREDFVTVTGEIPKSDIPAAGGEPSKTDVAYQTVGQVNNVASSVHVRKGAGTGVGCDIVTSVNSGELLMILGQVQPGGETIPWYEIDINGQELYIRSDFVDIISETKLDEQGTISSSEGWVHVRKLPGTGEECTIITTLNNGVSVEIVSQLQPKGESLPWYRIKMKSGIGFIRSDFFSNDFEEFLYLLKQLYSLKENQGLTIKDINHQILTALRTLSSQYNGTKFTMLAGNDKELFNLVKNNYPHLYSLLVRFSGNNQIPIKLGNTVVGIPHLAITTECYASSVPMPRFWSGWGGDLATFCAEAIRENWDKDSIYERMVTEKSSFTLLNFYEDIDAIYFAQNMNERPIYELVEYYYNLDNKSIALIRLNLLLKDIECNNMVNLADDIYNLFTGLKGMNFPFINNKHLLFIGLKEIVTTGGKYDVNYETIKLACDALAYKIKLLL